MGHKNKKSLIRQVQEKLVSQMAAGDSRHLDKAVGPEVTSAKIYSYGTLDAYLQQCCDFVKFVKAEHGAKSLEDCRPHVNEFLQRSIDSGKSSYTIKLQASALAKLYDCSSDQFIGTPARHREDITRSRGEAVRDTHFSEVRNKALVDFCCSTGLRRHELAALTGDCLRKDSQGNYHIYVRSGKGGKSRSAPVIGNKDQIQNVVNLCAQAGTGKVFSKVHNAADIHSYRRTYCTRLYDATCRPISSLLRGTSERYYCRGSMKGVVLDRASLQVCSQALGHNRISVVVSHYMVQDNAA